MNSLFNEFNTPSPPMNFLTQFNNFRQSFSGNPEAQVKQLIQSGRMSQEQFNQYAQMANQLSQLIK